MCDKRKTFSQNVFDRTKMRKYLPRATYTALCNRKNGEAIPEKHIRHYAKGLLKWAKTLGATCYSHRFDPFGCGTLGKYKQLFSCDLNGKPFEEFGAEQLLHDECDASAFPCGNLKTPSNARGQIKWFAALPPYVKDNCLCIPSVLTCAEGSLDEKTALFKSCLTLEKSVLQLLNILKMPCGGVFPVVGAEQEYFLQNKQQYLQRSDMVATGRMLTTKQSDVYLRNYCLQPNAKIRAFWNETEKRLWRLGIVAKTQHGEVSPCQFELTPCCAPTMLAYMQNRLITETLQEVADEFNMVCMLHEKPFPNMNGSGKHNNWSICTDKQQNLLDRGHSPAENARYAALIACVVRAVDLHQDLFLASAASVGNDCRVGKCEAPPGIISVSLGDALADLQKIADARHFNLEKDCLSAPSAATRNRTSPLCFNQNKFEFRLVGASDSLSDCNTVINTTVAESVDYLCEKLINSHNVFKDIQTFVGDVLQQNGRILFDGDNYGKQWKKEATERKLYFAANTPDALKSVEQNATLFQQRNVMTFTELHAKKCAKLEVYCEQAEREVTVLARLCVNIVLPVMRKLLFQQMRAEKTIKKQNCPNDLHTKLTKKYTTCIEKLSFCAKMLQQSLQDGSATTETRATCLAEALPETIALTQRCIDEARELCPTNLWPLFEINPQQLP